jgi:hypothetical protein
MPRRAYPQQRRADRLLYGEVGSAERFAALKWTSAQVECRGAEPWQLQKVQPLTVQPFGCRTKSGSASKMQAGL